METLFRSSGPEVSCKNVALKNFAIFTGGHLCGSLFFNKVGMVATLSRKRLRHRCFPVSFAKILTVFFLGYPRWLLPTFIPTFCT